VAAGTLPRRLLGVLGRRVTQLIPVLIGVTLVTFLMLRLLPGGPAQTLVGIRATPQAVAAVKRELGLDKPLTTQYIDYLGNLLHGHLGTSIISGTSVDSIVSSHLGATLELILYAVVIALLLGVPLAILAARYRDRWVDSVVRAVVVVTLGMPSFWLGVILILFLGLRLKWFPTGGDGSGVWGTVSHLFLPALTLALTFVAVLVRSMRASISDIIRATYVDAARLKGLSGPKLWRRHIIRTAILPVITLIGLNVSTLLGTSVVVENVFALSGMGQQLVSAILQRDFVVVQGITLVFGVIVLAISTLVDLVQTALDPRVTA
jgi:peptide/nickel transport system permease protein